jgi:hypothetical protein
MTSFSPAPSQTCGQAGPLDRLLAETVARALDAAPHLLAAPVVWGEGDGPAPAILDRGFRLLLTRLADALGGAGRINRPGLALALRLFAASNVAPPPAQGGARRAAALWPQLLAAADDLERGESASVSAGPPRAVMVETLKDLLAMALQAVAAALTAAGAVERHPFVLAASPSPPPLTPAQLSYELVAVAQAAVSAMGAPAPDPSATLQRLADALAYIEIAGAAPLSLPLQRLARCGQQITAEEETRHTVVWLDDDPPDPNHRPWAIP